MSCSIAKPATEPTPVILISVDTLRADHLSAYGYRKIQTPNLDAFSVHGSVFKAIDSQIPLTLPSHTCLFTSTYPFENGVEENAEAVPANLMTLAVILQKHGYRTGAFIGSDLLAPRFKLDRGFDVYDSPFHPDAAGQQSPYDVRVRRDAALVVRAASQWLSMSGGKPPFLFLHLFDLHAPYSVPSPNRLEPNTAGYDAELEYVDRVMGRFRKMLLDKGWWDRALVILLSDHGESLGEHGETSHGYFIYQSTLWVPLLIHWPANVQAFPAVVEQPGGLIDVAPTILDFLHIEAPAGFHGVSLLKKTARSGVYSESVYARDAFHWAALRSLRTDNLQYVDAPSAELYNLQADAKEQTNVIRRQAEQARQLHNRLRKLMEAYSSRQPVAAHDRSSETSNTLRSLGYISESSTGTSPNGGADPKDRLPEYQMYERGLEALYDHRELQAAGLFKALLAGDAANTLARYYLGEAYLRLERPSDAIQEWRSVLQQEPGFTAASQAIDRLGKR